MKFLLKIAIYIIIFSLLQACGGSDNNNTNNNANTANASLFSITSYEYLTGYQNVYLSGEFDDLTPSCSVDIVIVTCVPNATIRWYNATTNTWGDGYYFPYYGYCSTTSCSNVSWNALIPLSIGDNQVSITISNNGSDESINRIFTHPENHQPAILLSSIESVSQNDALITATIESGGYTSMAWLEWSDDSTLTNYITSDIITITSVNHVGEYSKQITGLMPGTTYYFRVAVEAGGFLIKSPISQFTTSLATP